MATSNDVACHITKLLSSNPTITFSRKSILSILERQKNRRFCMYTARIIPQFTCTDVVKQTHVNMVFCTTSVLLSTNNMSMTLFRNHFVGIKRPQRGYRQNRTIIYAKYDERRVNLPKASHKGTCAVCSIVSSDSGHTSSYTGSRLVHI